MNSKWLAPSLFAAILLVLLLPSTSLGQRTPEIDKVDPALLQALSQEGATADVIVSMESSADLSAAAELEEWHARGWAVYDALRQAAAQSQTPVIAYARKKGLTYRSFFSTNAVYVQDADLTAAQDLGRLPGVAQVRLPQVALVLPNSGQAHEGELAGTEAYGWNLDTLDPGGGLYGMQAAQVWDQVGVTGEGVVVANIDTGVYYQHISLDRQYRGNLSGNVGGPYEHDYNWYQPNYIACGNGTYPCDAEHHGTSTMGIMVAETPNLEKQLGVAPGARWIACQGCDDPPYCTEVALLGCADWMLAPCAIGDDPGDPSCNPDMRPHIINNSWGGAGCDTWYQASVQAWVAAGLFPAFAAGNAGGCGTVANPGDLPESFGVAAHFTDGLNAYSGGPSCFFPAPTCDPDAHDIDPHVNAPTGGEAPIAEQGQYFALGGTSGASPHVAGTVALLWSGQPGLTGQIDATFTILEQSANRDLPAPLCGKPACAGENDYPNYDFGWGYLDALAAVEMVGAGSVGALQGTVVEAAPLSAPGDPLPDVTIKAERAGSAFVVGGTTGPTGYYTMTLTSGTYTVTADGPQHGPATVNGVTIVTDSVTTVDFELLPKGILHGYVNDAETGAPLAATVTSPGAGSASTDPVTGYYSMYLGQGSHDVIAESSNYASQRVTVEIISGQQTEQNFPLVPALAMAPLPLDVSVELLGDAEVTTVITNNMVAPYEYALVHKASRAGDEGTVLLVHDETLDENPDAFAIAFENLGYDYSLVDAEAFYETPIEQLLSYAAVVYTGSPSAGAEQEHVIAYLEAGGRFLLSDFVFTSTHGDSRLHEIFLQALDDGYEEWAGPQTGLDIMAGLYPDISSQIVVYDSYAGPDGVGIFQSPGSHFTGIRTERAGYRAIFLSFDLNRIGDRDPGDAGETDVVYRAMLWLLGYPVTATWFDTDVAGGTVPPEGSSAFASQFSATPGDGIEQPGEFYAELHIQPEAVGEIYPRLDVPVHMTVLPTPTMGKVTGTVAGDRPGGPIATGVEIEGEGGESWIVASDWWTGVYEYWLEAGDYTLTVAADGYYTETAEIAVVAGMTTTQDFELILAAPEISIAPRVLEDAVPFGSSTTRSLRIDNSGPEPLHLDVNERDRGRTPLVGGILGATPESVDGARILFDKAHGGNPTYYSELITDLESLGATVDVWPSGRITETVLAGYDILFIGDFIDIEYHFTELDAIDAFVRQGGGLFVTYEFGDETNVPMLTKMYGVEYIGRGGTGGITHNVYPHPTTVDVGNVYIPSPQYVMSATLTGTAEIVLYDVGGTPAAAVNEVDNGKVFVMPDQQFWDGVYGQADNTQLGRNVFGWLYGDAAWLATDAESGTIAPGEAMTLTVTLDGGAVDEPAICHGDLVLLNDDPLAPSVGVPVTLTVEPTADLGRLHGTVTGDRPGGPLAAGLLIEDSGGASFAVYSVPSTGAYQRWLPGGVYTVTASSGKYVTQTTTVDVPAGGEVQLDFELLYNGPGIATFPAAVEENVVWGLTATQWLTVSNVGLQDLEFSIVEEDQGSEPFSQGTLAYAFDFENDDFVKFYLDAPGEWEIIKHWDYQHFEGGDFRLNDYSQLYVIWGNYLATLDSETGDYDIIPDPIEIPYPHTMAGMTIDADGTLYVVSYVYDLLNPYESYLWTVDPDHATATLIGQITNAEAVLGIAINLEGEMYGVDVEQDVLLQIDPDTAAGTTVGALGLDLWNAHIEFDDDSGKLCMCTWDYLSGLSYLWTIDTVTGLPTVVGQLPEGTGLAFIAIVADGLVDIPWLSEAPIGGTVPPGGELGIELTFDASGVVGPGDYWGRLHMQSSDPLLPDLTVPVTMTVLASGDLGQVVGTVTGLGYCDADPQPLEAEVLLEASDGVTWTVTSDPVDGSYSRWVPAGLYTVTASAPAHVPQTTLVQAEVGQSTVQDFELRLFEACLALAPTTFSVTLSVDTVWTETLSISNGGARDLIWAIRETTDTLFLPPLPPIPRFEGELPADATPISVEPAPWTVGHPPEPEAPASLPGQHGAPAYGLDTSTFDLVHIPDITEPGIWEEVGNLGTFYSGGDFWHGDFSRLYALDFWTSELVTIDTSTAERTVLGTANTLPGHHWTGLTAATDGTLYGVSSEVNVASALYTINPATAAATLIGTSTAAPTLIDIAVNAQGEIYAVDILWDGLYRLDPDPEPGADVATFIGNLGFDANHAQSMDFDEDSGILYWAATSNYNGSLRRIDTNTGNSLHLGYFPNHTSVDCLAFTTGGGGPFWSDVPWVTEVPSSGVTPADGATEVDVVFDATSLAEECYPAALGLVHDDDGYEQPAIVPVTLCIRLPWPVFYLRKSANTEEVSAGDPLTYTLMFGNDGSLETGITISDVLPAAVDYVGSEPPGAYDPVAHEVVWDGLVLDEGARMTTTITVTVGTGLPPGTWFTNTANLLWRDVAHSDWVRQRVGAGQRRVYLPLVLRGHPGE